MISWPSDFDNNDAQFDSSKIVTKIILTLVIMMASDKTYNAAVVIVFLTTKMLSVLKLTMMITAMMKQKPTKFSGKN